MFKFRYLFVLVLSVHHVSSGKEETVLSLYNSSKVLTTAIVDPMLPLSRPQHWNLYKLSGKVKAQKIATGLLPLAEKCEANHMYNLAGISIIFVHSNKEPIGDRKEFLAKKFPTEFKRMSRDKVIGVATAGKAKSSLDNQKQNITDECYAVIVILQRSTFLEKLGNPPVSIPAIIEGIQILECERKAKAERQDDGAKQEDFNKNVGSTQFSKCFPTFSLFSSGESLDDSAADWVSTNGNEGLLNAPKANGGSNKIQSYAFFYLNQDNKLTIAAIWRETLAKEGEEVYAPATIESAGAWAEQGLQVLDSVDLIGKRTNSKFSDDSIYTANKYAQAVAFALVDIRQKFQDFLVINLPNLTVIVRRKIGIGNWPEIIKSAIESELIALRKNQITGVGIDGVKEIKKTKVVETFAVIVIAMESSLLQALPESVMDISVKATIAAVEAKLHFAEIKEPESPFGLPFLLICQDVTNESATDDDIQMKMWLSNTDNLTALLAKKPSHYCASTNLKPLPTTVCAQEPQSMSYAFAQWKVENQICVAKFFDSGNEGTFKLSDFTARTKAGKYNKIIVSDSDVKLETQAKEELERLRYQHSVQVCKTAKVKLEYNPLDEDKGHALALLEKLVLNRTSGNKSTTKSEVEKANNDAKNKNVVMIAASVDVSVQTGQNFGDRFCDELKKIIPNGANNIGQNNTNCFNIFDKGLTAFALRVLTYSLLTDAQADYVVEIVLLKVIQESNESGVDRNPADSSKEVLSTNDKDQSANEKKENKNGITAANRDETSGQNNANDNAQSSASNDANPNNSSSGSAGSHQDTNTAAQDLIIQPQPAATPFLVLLQNANLKHSTTYSPRRNWDQWTVDTQGNKAETYAQIEEKKKKK